MGISRTSSHTSYVLTICDGQVLHVVSISPNLFNFDNVGWLDVDVLRMSSPIDHLRDWFCISRVTNHPWWLQDWLQELSKYHSNQVERKDQGHSYTGGRQQHQSFKHKIDLLDPYGRSIVAGVMTTALTYWGSPIKHAVARCIQSYCTHCYWPAKKGIVRSWFHYAIVFRSSSEQALASFVIIAPSIVSQPTCGCATMMSRP